MSIIEVPATDILIRTVNRLIGQSEIQYALKKAQPGDTILVISGEYLEDLITIEKDITLKIGSNVIIQDSVITKKGVGPVIELEGNNILIKNSTIRHEL